MRNPTKQPESAQFGVYNLGDACRALVKFDPPGFRDALRQAARTKGDMYVVATYFQAISYGALAALSDQEAAKRLRSLAKAVDGETRLAAAEWLGRSRDRDSIPLLRELTQDREKDVREAAQKALSEIARR